MAVERHHTATRMSQIVIHGDTISLAGQVSDDAENKSAGEQTRNILGKIDSYLAEAGSDKSNILSATIWLSDIRYFNAMNEVWDAWVADGNAPARACVEAKLAGTQFLDAIGIIAGKP